MTEQWVGRGGLESVFSKWLIFHSAPVNPAVIPLMFSIEARELHWLGDTPTQDLCAHGEVSIYLNDDLVVYEKDVCVSAAAIYLLRTLLSNHDNDSRVAEHLLPCCGHMMLDLEDEEDVVIIGCSNGYDWQVVHLETPKTVLEFDDRESIELDNAIWNNAVRKFSEQVYDFYQSSDTKTPCDKEQADGYNAMMEEWNRRLAMS